MLDYRVVERIDTPRIDRSDGARNAYGKAGVHCNNEGDGGVERKGN